MRCTERRTTWRASSGRSGRRSGPGCVFALSTLATEVIVYAFSRPAPWPPRPAPAPLDLVTLDGDREMGTCHSVWCYAQGDDWPRSFTRGVTSWWDVGTPATRRTSWDRWERADRRYLARRRVGRARARRGAGPGSRASSRQAVRASLRGRRLPRGRRRGCASRLG